MLSNNLRLAKAKYAFGTWIPADDKTVVIQHEDGVIRGALYQKSELLFCTL